MKSTYKTLNLDKKETYKSSYKPSYSPIGEIGDIDLNTPQFNRNNPTVNKRVNEFATIEPSEQKSGVTSEQTKDRVAKEYVDDLFNFADNFQQEQPEEEKKHASTPLQLGELKIK